MSVLPHSLGEEHSSINEEIPKTTHSPGRVNGNAEPQGKKGNAFSNDEMRPVSPRAQVPSPNHLAVRNEVTPLVPNVDGGTMEANVDMHSDRSSRGGKKDSPSFDRTNSNSGMVDHASAASFRSGKSSSNGILSNFLSAAHNVISFNSNEGGANDRNEHTFSQKLDSLLKTKSEKSTSASPSRTSIDSEKENNLTTNVQFEPVRESPVNTLGFGELTLDHFDAQSQPQKGVPARLSRRISSTPNQSTENLNSRRSLSPDIVNRQTPVSSQLVVSGSRENKRVRRKSLIGALEKIKSHNNDKMGDEESNMSESFSVDDEKPVDPDEIDYASVSLASERRNREFHHVFKQLPSNEKLIEEYNCALSKDILVQGKMYLSEHTICFNSNILGWVTNLMIPLQEVIQIEKKFTAGLFPNGIVVRTLRHKYVFASLLNRDSSFNLITSVWHKVLAANDDSDGVNALKVNRKTSDLKSLTSKSDSETQNGSDDDSSNNSNSVSSLSLNSGDSNDGDDTNGNSTSDVDGSDNVSTNDGDKGDVKPSGDKDNLGSFHGLPTLGPLTHPPTKVNYDKQSSDTFITENILKAPLGSVFSLLFGSDISYYIKVLKNQKNFDISDGITALDEKNEERNYTYTKPLSASIGPKQTKCIISDKLLHYDLNDYVLVEQTTSTPDVPSGNVFKVRTRLYLSWAENNYTKFYVHTSVEWSGKSWIKGAIEKGSIDGQKDSMKIMVESLTGFLKSAETSPDTSKKKTRRRKSIKTETQPKEEPVLVKPPELSVLDQISNLMESIGRSVPIPYLSSKVSGILVVSLLFMIILRVHSAMLNNPNPTLEIVPENHTFSNIKINNQRYMVVSSVDANFANADFKLETETNLWDWILDRSDGQLKVLSDSSSHLRRYSNQEIKEIVRLTQMKLDELNKNYVEQS